MRAQKLSLAVAESCTGGWLGKACSDLPGSSAWFAGGIIAYTSEVKIALLDVPATTLETEGSVSEAVVIAMCAGTLRHILNADIAVAISGNAGPSGEPPGLVWLASQRRGETAHAHSVRYDGERAEVRAQAVVGALEIVISAIK